MPPKTQDLKTQDTRRKRQRAAHCIIGIGAHRVPLQAIPFPSLPKLVHGVASSYLGSCVFKSCVYPVIFWREKGWRSRYSARRLRRVGTCAGRTRYGNMAGRLMHHPRWLGAPLG